jgi:hypothetical protein
MFALSQATGRNSSLLFYGRRRKNVQSNFGIFYSAQVVIIVFFRYKSGVFTPLRLLTNPAFFGSGVFHASISCHAAKGWPLPKVAMERPDKRVLKRE